MFGFFLCLFGIDFPLLAYYRFKLKFWLKPEYETYFSEWAKAHSYSNCANNRIK